MEMEIEIERQIDRQTGIQTGGCTRRREKTI